MVLAKLFTLLGFGIDFNTQNGQGINVQVLGGAEYIRTVKLPYCPVPLAGIVILSVQVGEIAYGFKLGGIGTDGLIMLIKHVAIPGEAASGVAFFFGVGDDIGKAFFGYLGIWVIAHKISGHTTYEVQRAGYQGQATISSPAK